MMMTPLPMSTFTVRYTLPGQSGRIVREVQAVNIQHAIDLTARDVPRTVYIVVNAVTGETTMTYSAYLTKAINRALKIALDAGHARSAQEINSAYCSDFARTVWASVGRPASPFLYFSSCYADESGHTWLTHRGMHYDAECPAGVSDWKMLPYWRRDSALAEPIMDNSNAVLDLPA